MAAGLNRAGVTPSASGRIRSVPDTRTIRFYTTLGLIDGPAEMRGRTAYYGQRHLLQLVAVKRLQASDLTLSDIQKQLTGLTNRRLKTIAGLPDGFWKDAEKHLQHAEAATSNQRSGNALTTDAVGQSNASANASASSESASQDGTAFWNRMPGDVVAECTASSDSTASNLMPPANTAAPMARWVLAIDEGVELHVDAGRAASDGIDPHRIAKRVNIALQQLINQGAPMQTP
ncbi:MAG: MerR family transcriptional regulator [Planctomycetota bacterium]